MLILKTWVTITYFAMFNSHKKGDFRRTMWKQFQVLLNMILNHYRKDVSSYWVLNRRPRNKHQVERTTGE